MELIELIRERGYPFCVGAAAYPETHQESPDVDTDLRHLKAKVDAGADFLITQLFHDNARWFDFIGRVREAGITVPVIPGLMPIINRDGIVRMAELSGASLPDGLRRQLDAGGDDAEAVLEIGVAHTTAQAVELLDSGTVGIHFYTLNRSRATREIVGAIRAHRGGALGCAAHETWLQSALAGAQPGWRSPQAPGVHTARAGPPPELSKARACCALRPSGG